MPDITYDYTFSRPSLDLTEITLLYIVGLYGVTSIENLLNSFVGFFERNYISFIHEGVVDYHTFAFG